MEVYENVFLGIGSNLGDRELFLHQALELILKNVGEIVAISSVYETEAWGNELLMPFLNVVLQIQTKYTPDILLSKVLDIEIQMGRQRNEKWSDRCIDIDILLFDNQVIDSSSLTIPHLYITQRRFVLEALVEISPSVVHPVTDVPFVEYLAIVEDKCWCRFYQIKDK